MTPNQRTEDALTENELKTFTNQHDERYNLSECAGAPRAGFCVADSGAQCRGSEKRRRDAEGEVVGDTQTRLKQSLRRDKRAVSDVPLCSLARGWGEVECGDVSAGRVVKGERGFYVGSSCG